MKSKHTNKVVKCMVNGGEVKGDTQKKTIADRIREVVTGKPSNKEGTQKRRIRNIEEALDAAEGKSK